MGECPTCNGSKYVSVECPVCSGQGETMEECPDCSPTTQEEKGED